MLARVSRVLTSASPSPSNSLLPFLFSSSSSSSSSSDASSPTTEPLPQTPSSLTVEQVGSLMAQGRAALSKNDHNSALKLFSQLVDSPPSAEQADEVVTTAGMGSDLADGSGSTTRMSLWAAALQLRAGVHLVLNNPQGAEADATALIESLPNPPPTPLYIRGDARSRLENHEGAAEDFEAFSKAARPEVYPDQATYHSVLGEAALRRGASLLAAGRHTDAIHALSSVLKTDIAPQNASGWMLLGVCHQTGSEHDSAVEAFSKVLSIQPGNPVAYYNRALSNSSRKQYDAAISDLDAAARIDPGSPHISNQRAHIFMAQSDWDSAAKAFDHSISLVSAAGGIAGSSPGPPAAEDARPPATVLFTAHFDGGRCALAVQNFDKARGHFDAALDIIPNHPGALVNRSYVALEDGDAQGAVDRCSAAIAAAPGYAAAYQNRAVAYERLGKTKLADADVDRVIELNKHAEAKAAEHAASAEA